MVCYHFIFHSFIAEDYVLYKGGGGQMGGQMGELKMLLVLHDLRPLKNVYI